MKTRKHALPLRRFAALLAIATSPQLVAQVAAPTASGAPERVLVRDVTDDGLVDRIVIAADGTPRVEVGVGGRARQPVAQALPPVACRQLLVADLDSDGLSDLYFVGDGHNVALRGLGAGRFEAATGPLGLADAGGGRSAASVDLDADGLPDLLLHNADHDVVFWGHGNGFTRDPDTPTVGASLTSGMPTPGPATMSSPIAGIAAGPAPTTDQRVAGARGEGATTTPAPIPAVGDWILTQLDPRYVNDGALEVDGATDVVDGSLTGDDIADGSLSAADVSTSSGDVVHLGAVGIGMAPHAFSPLSMRMETGATSTVWSESDHTSQINLVADIDGSHGGPWINRIISKFNGDFTFEQPGVGPVLFFDGASHNVGVGAGATNPQATLDVNGDAVVRGIMTTDVLTILGGADLAEPFDLAPGCDPVEPGTVLSIDPEHPGRLRPTSLTYDRCVAGVVSGANGVDTGLLLRDRGSPADGELPVALSGRVYVRCDADAGGPIAPGDLLTTAERAGHAMRASDPSRAFGAVLGKALTPLDEGTGLVLVLVSLQ